MIKQMTSTLDNLVEDEVKGAVSTGGLRPDCGHFYQKILVVSKSNTSLVSSIPWRPARSKVRKHDNSCG